MMVTILVYHPSYGYLWSIMDIYGGYLWCYSNGYHPTIMDDGHHDGHLTHHILHGHGSLHPRAAAPLPPCPRRDRNDRRRPRRWLQRSRRKGIAAPASVAVMPRRATKSTGRNALECLGVRSMVIPMVIPRGYIWLFLWLFLGLFLRVIGGYA